MDRDGGFSSSIGLMSYPPGMLDEALEDHNDNQESSESSEEPIPFPDIEEEMNILGEPPSRQFCFGCKFIGESKSAAVSSEKLREIFTLIKDGMGRTDPIALAQEVNVLYSEMRLKANGSISNSRLHLPDWKEATILDHFRNHNTDPQIQLWLQVDRVQKIMTLITKESMVLINKKTGKRKIDKEQWNIYNQASLRWERLMSKNPAKMMFFDEDSHMSTPKGIISTDGKRVYNFFNDARSSRRRLE